MALAQGAAKPRAVDGEALQACLGFFHLPLQRFELGDALASHADLLFQLSELRFERRQLSPQAVHLGLVLGTAGDLCLPVLSQSTLILQPGPAALTDGLDALTRIVGEWAAQRPAAVA